MKIVTQYASPSFDFAPCLSVPAVRLGGHVSPRCERAFESCRRGGCRILALVLGRSPSSGDRPPGDGQLKLRRATNRRLAERWDRTVRAGANFQPGRGQRLQYSPRRATQSFRTLFSCVVEGFQGIGDGCVECVARRFRSPVAGALPILIRCRWEPRHTPLLLTPFPIPLRTSPPVNVSMSRTEASFARTSAGPTGGEAHRFCDGTARIGLLGRRMRLLFAPGFVSRCVA